MFRLFKYILTILILVVLYFVIVIYWTGYQKPNLKPADAAVVFGAAQYNGQPSPIFAARLDWAKKLDDQKTIKKIIVTGGKGRKADTVSEGRAGRNYLVDLGVDAQNIIFEEQSKTTQENLTELKKILVREKIQSVIFVSDRFHIFRISAMAEKEGISFQLSPTETSPVEKNRLEELKYVLIEVRNYFNFVVFGS